ncbi:hypothetical protein L6R52_34100 [Myxococcota bacterium]|nr:hypothetical protein [Myxococcota bacterium]
MARTDKKKADEWDEFECPECTAHNPYGKGFTIGDEIFCSYCGQTFLVKKKDDDGEGKSYRLVLV